MPKSFMITAARAFVHVAGFQPVTVGVDLTLATFDPDYDPSLVLPIGKWQIKGFQLPAAEILWGLWTTASWVGDVANPVNLAVGLNRFIFRLDNPNPLLGTVFTWVNSNLLLTTIDTRTYGLTISLEIISNILGVNFSERVAVVGGYDRVAALP